MSVSKTTYYSCPMCGEDFDDADEALDHCEPEYVEMYKCLKCSKLHEDEDVAKRCCFNPTGRSVLVCDECGAQYAPDDYEMAFNCCS